MTLFECELCGNEYSEQTMNQCNGNHAINCPCNNINNCQSKCMRYCCPKCNFCSIECQADENEIRVK